MKERLLLGSLLFCVLFGAQQRSIAQSNPVLAHWSQIVGHSQSTTDVLPMAVMGRFIVDGAGRDCAAFKVIADSAVTPATPASKPVARVLPNDSAFPISVCQFPMAADWRSAELLQNNSATVLAKFPGPYQVGRNNADKLVIIGIGDTGCRAADCQAENNRNRVFAEVVQTAVAQAPSPDFIVHVGDYRYYDENQSPDAWWKWQMEFFKPAQALLNLAPVVLSRGNHEECSGDEGYWYGQRWYQFFEPTDAATVTPCPKNSPALHDSWYFDVGVKSGSTVSLPQRLIMVDNSADAKNFGCNNFSPSSSNCPVYKQVVDAMQQNFAQAIQWGVEFKQNNASDHANVWWLMHKPLWNYPNRYPSTGTDEAVLHALGNTSNQPVSKTLCDPDCTPDAILSGHAHMYQRSVFTNGDWPVQYVLGISGVSPLTGSSTRLSYDFLPPNDFHGQFAATVNLIYQQNGFLIYSKTADTKDTYSGWAVTLCLLEKDCHLITPMPANRPYQQ